MGIEAEKLMMFEADKAAEIGHKKYKKQVEALEKSSLLSKARSINSFDIQALCKQLDQWKQYESFVMHETGNLNLLGKLPKIALTTRAFAL